MTVFKDIKAAIDGQMEAFDAFRAAHDERAEKTEKQIKSLLDRTEELEAKNSTIKRPCASAKTTAEGVKTFMTAHGTVTEIDHKTRLSDVLPPETSAPVSFDRWVGAHVAGERSGDKDALAFALEWQKKQLSTSTGGILIPVEYQGEWIDLIRSQMVLNAAGMRTVDMQAKSQVHAAVATDPVAAWHSESANIDPGNPTFVERSLSAKTLVTRCQGSVELAQDSPDFGRQLSAVMSRAMAQEIDRAGLFGSGNAPEPQGLYGADGVATVDDVGTPTDYSDLLEGVRTLLDTNVPLQTAAANAIMSPRTWESYESLKTGIASDNTQLPRPRAIETTAFRVTTAVSDALGESSPPDESAIFMGDFRDLILGVRRESAIEILKLQTYASNLLLEFVGYTRVDFLIARPSSFVVLDGVTAT
jgi:HK97 family phage major capsid protein